MKRVNGTTGAFIHAFEPLRIEIARAEGAPSSCRNFLARALEDPLRWPSPHWHLVELTEQPQNAHWRLLDVDLNYFEGDPEGFRACLRGFGDHSAPWIFVDHRDTPNPFEGPAGARFLKANVGPDANRHSVTAVPYWEVVDDFRWYADHPVEPRFSLSFIGEWTEFRAELTGALARRVPESRLVLRDRFFHGPLLRDGPGGHTLPSLQPARHLDWRRDFIETIRASRFALCMQGFGPMTFRFYEALSLGRPPVLVTAPCILPFEDKIDYGAFSLIFHAAANIETLADSIVATLRSIDEDRWLAMCAQARAVYDLHFSAAVMPLQIHRILDGAAAGVACADTVSEAFVECSKKE